MEEDYSNSDKWGVINEECIVKSNKISYRSLALGIDNTYGWNCQIIMSGGGWGERGEWMNIWMNFI